MQIKELTIIESQGQGKSFYSIKLDENLYYVTYEENEIKTTADIEFASRIDTKEFAEGVIGFIQKFYDDNGQRKHSSALGRVTTVKGYALEHNIGIRTVQRMCEDGRLKAKNVHGVWLIEYDAQN